VSRETWTALEAHPLAPVVDTYRVGPREARCGYVTIAQLRAEGQAVGTITLGGVLFYVSVSQGPLPRQLEQ
jgi:hypothetical protein